MLGLCLVRAKGEAKNIIHQQAHFCISKKKQFYLLINDLFIYPFLPENSFMAASPDNLCFYLTHVWLRGHPFREVQYFLRWVWNKNQLGSCQMGGLYLPMQKAPKWQPGWWSCRTERSGTIHQVGSFLGEQSRVKKQLTHQLHSWNWKSHWEWCFYAMQYSISCQPVCFVC